MKISQELKDEIYFVIPAYNEEKVIEKVIKNLHDEGFYKLVIVNDGSSDRTSQILLEYESKGVILLEHVINRGQGAALKTGIEFASMQDDCKYIVTFDSDGQHRISDLPSMVEFLENDKCDIVLGSRFLKKESRKLVPLKKRILLKGALLVTFFVSGIKLTDTHNGYRVMKKDVARKIDITMDGFEHASEILDEISKKKIRYKEVPVFIDYTDYSKQKGQSVLNSVRILLKMIFK